MCLKHKATNNAITGSKAGTCMAILRNSILFHPQWDETSILIMTVTQLSNFILKIKYRIKSLLIHCHSKDRMVLCPRMIILELRIVCGSKAKKTNIITFCHFAAFESLDARELASRSGSFKSDYKVPFSFALAQASLVKRVAHVFIVAFPSFVRVMWWLAAFSPVDASNAVVVATIQAPKEKSFLA